MENMIYPWRQSSKFKRDEDDVFGTMGYDRLVYKDDSFIYRHTLHVYMYVYLYESDRKRLNKP